ncbi:MAG TPA: carboxylesterase/lipase family protein [Steroidobacteraceae bacterium]|nr:carboxylesterase/lipase family protein [Steroidobacteraceae bacterium]
MASHCRKRLTGVRIGRREFVAGAISSFATLPVFAAGKYSIATTRYGKVRGVIQNNIHVFKGIRYGADTSKRRFLPPLPPASWSGIVDALDYGPASPQPRSNEKTSEDCLFLNVWTPGLRDNAKRPVMFYIHGGAYSNGSGSSPLYDGTRLCERGDVVVVTVNHRLNLFGYLSLGRFGISDFADSGNAGQLDLVLALQWVRDNIAEFGGDSNKVMLFGQSGGGAKIATLMAMQSASGLFHRAATMSGQQLTASGPLNAYKRTLTFLETLKTKDVESLRTLPTEKLIEASRATAPIIGKGSLYFGPVLDERSLTRHPFYPDAPPLSKRIPMIIGNTHDETRSLIGGSDPSAFQLKWEDLSARLADNMRVDIEPKLVIDEYRKLYPRYSPSDVFFSATTASRSWRAAIIEAELRAQQGAPAFSYQLDWPSPQDGGKWRAPHTLDIPLVFDNIDKPGSITGTGDDAKKMANQISDAFISFAKTGDPNHVGIPKWEPYTLPRRATMVFNTTSKLIDDPRGDERKLFEKVPFIQQGT